MATYNLTGFLWVGQGNSTTLSSVVITDDDLYMSSYADTDLTETLTFDGITYTGPNGGIQALTFTDSNGNELTENFLVFLIGSEWVVVLMPESSFDSGSVVLSTGDNDTDGFLWADVVCFTKGTEITTPIGDRLIETLKTGDLVITRDHGIQAVRWIGRKVVSKAQLSLMPHLYPVRIEKEAFGPYAPHKDTWLSPQHMVLHESAMNTLHFGNREVFVPVKGLVNDTTVITDTSVTTVEYIHIMFDRHEIIYANGMPCESFLPGEMAINAIDGAGRAELFDIFPDLKGNLESYSKRARYTLTVTEAKAHLTIEGKWGALT